MDLDIKREALNHAVALTLADMNNGGGAIIATDVTELATGLEAYLTGGDAK